MKGLALIILTTLGISTVLGFIMLLTALDFEPDVKKVSWSIVVYLIIYYGSLLCLVAN